MQTEKNIFGSHGTNSDQIVQHFNTMRTEAVNLFDYHAITLGDLGMYLESITDLEHQLSDVATRINMLRESIENKAVNSGIFE